VQLLREHYDAEWELLPVRELREYERVLVGNCSGEQCACSGFFPISFSGTVFAFRST
jgi:hypothetical protein